MKARKNKKRIDTKYQMPREEESAMKEDINFNDFSFDSWLIQEMYPEAGSMPTGQDYKTAGKREDDLPEEVPEDDARERANKDTDSSMEEGRCAAEMPSEDAEEEIMTHHPDNAFEAGYAAAVEEIMASIEGLLGDPIEMAPVGSEMDMEQLPDHAMEIDEKKKPDEDGDGVPDWADKKPGEDDHAEAMNEQPSIEDLMRKGMKDSPYADMPEIQAKLVRKGPVLETVPMVDSASAKNPEALKDVIRTWLKVGYGVDEVELTSDGQAMDVAEFLDIDPMEEA